MKIDKGLMSGSTAMLVLSLLQGGDKYGYQMIQDLTICSQNVFDLKEGTLYPVLHALEKEGSLKSYEKSAPSGRARKYYTITERGRKQLAEKKQQWEVYSGAVEQVLQLS